MRLTHRIALPLTLAALALTTACTPPQDEGAWAQTLRRLQPLEDKFIRLRDSATSSQAETTEAHNAIRAECIKAHSYATNGEATERAVKDKCRTYGDFDPKMD